jgi:uncharacterized protein YndB with AHSA1/START domain
MMAALPIVAALLLTTDAPVPPGKERTDRTISLEVTVDAPPADVFRLWTTSEGATKFLAPAAHIEPKVGGRYQIIFDPVGDPEGAYHGTKVGRVLRIVPDKELSFEWPMPPFGPELGGPPVPTWVELEFLPAPDKTGRTRLRFAQYGFRTGEKWDAAFALFRDKNWPLVLNRLVVYCRDKVSPAWAATQEKPGDALDRILVKDVTVQASLADVWKAWTTAEGVQTFFAPAARIEAVPGGPYEIYFSKDAPAGSRGAEGCKVLAVDPMRSFAFDWSAPPTMPEVRTKRTNVQIQLTEKGPKEVAVHLVSLGWGTGDEWVAAHQYFDEAWASVLGSLQKRFAEGPRVWTSQ